MSETGWYTFSASAENLTLLADAGDFFALIGGTTPWRLLEVRVFQRGTTTLTMDSILIHRGTAAAGGGALTEYEYNTSGPTATVAAVSLPTTDVGTDDWQYRMGFNLLQEAHKLPIPKLWVPCKANDDIGITRATTTAHTGVGVEVVWEEYVGS
jgi:hypothetical protein